MFDPFLVAVPCLFGILFVVAAGFVLVIAAIMIGATFWIDKKSRPIFELNSEDFFADAVPQLLMWNANAFNDFSPLIDCKAAATFKRTRAMGTVKSLRDPEAMGWMAFDVSAALGKGASLRLKTSEHDVELAVGGGFLNFRAQVSAHQQPIGRLRAGIRRITILDRNGREIGACQFPRRVVIGWKPIYGDIYLHGQNIGRLNKNIWPLFASRWRPRPSPLPPVFQLERVAVSDDDQVWLLALVGLLIYRSILRAFHGR